MTRELMQREETISLGSKKLPDGSTMQLKYLRLWEFGDRMSGFFVGSEYAQPAEALRSAQSRSNLTLAFVQAGIGTPMTGFLEE